MRRIGTQAFGIRLPIISQGDDLAAIVTDSLLTAITSPGLSLHETDVVGITEALLAKAQGNYATIDQIAKDVSNKFSSGEVGVVFPICSRNRFMNVLKGIARGVKKVHLLLQYPTDEVGNPIVSMQGLDALQDSGKTLFTAEEFRSIGGPYIHPFTGLDYIRLYQEVSDNITVYLSMDPRSILQLTDQILIGEIHSRDITRKRLIKAGATTIYTLADILSTPVDNSGYNPDFGVLGSNLATDEILKLFPRDCDPFIRLVQDKIYASCGIRPEVLIYGDGAFKDPVMGIWELADPVVSPAFTSGLAGQPNEIKIKFVADNMLKELGPAEKALAVSAMIKEKNLNKANLYNEGTTPRKYADLLGSLCDLISGSGDKGTPVVLVQGYFDDFSTD